MSSSSSASSVGTVTFSPAFAFFSCASVLTVTALKTLVHAAMRLCIGSSCAPTGVASLS